MSVSSEFQVSAGGMTVDAAAAAECEQTRFSRLSPLSNWLAVGKASALLEYLQKFRVLAH